MRGVLARVAGSKAVGYFLAQLQEQGVGIWRFLRYLAAPGAQGRRVGRPPARQKAARLPPDTWAYLQIASTYLHFAGVFARERMTPLRALIYAFQDPRSFDPRCLSKADKMLNLGYLRRLRRLGVEVKLVDVRMGQSSSEPYECYFVVLRGAAGELVVNVRGTENVGDCLTDLDVAVHEEGFHRGFFRQAERCFEYLRGQAYFLEAERVVFTGYSMGGSVATILQVLARRAGIGKTRCYAFSAPPTVTAAISERYLQEGCYSFIIEDDIVPTCSRHGIRLAVLRARLFLDGVTGKNSGGLSTESACEDDCFLGGEVYWLCRGEFYRISRHEYAELVPSLQNCCYHAAAPYCARRLRKLGV